jgi:hypothetical protein
LIWAVLSSSWFLLPAHSASALESMGNMTREPALRALTTLRNETRSTAASDASSAFVSRPASSTEKALELRPARQKLEPSAALTALRPTQTVRPLPTKPAPRSRKSVARASGGRANLQSLEATSKPATSRRMMPAELEFGF